MKNNFRAGFAAARVMALAVVALVAFSVPQQSVAKKKKIGYQLYNVMAAVQRNPKASLERLAKIGYNQVELVQWGGDEKVFGLAPKDFKKLCKDNGIKIISTHSGIQEDPAKEEEVMNRWRKLFAIQKAVGGKYFVVPSYQIDYTVEGMNKMCAYFNRVGKLAKEYGLTLGYHNHSHEFQKLKDSDKLMWEYFVENTDPKYVCFELDVYWCTKAGMDPVEYLRKYPKRIQLMHIKDAFVLGESGQINFEGIFNQFYKNGWKNYFVEIETPQWLRDKKNADGSKYTEDQVENEMFKASEESYKYLEQASFVK